ncbi:MAG TPA: UDP-N-acetylmuramoyl-tripeptide--D-alanyl-D-alanine ligase [Rhodocyclaceae bacterium]|nr:UDP-N-acetylmuramoyl-tripeptide--D-alanyl-D-alanine ligase [Rhodocyclaceae bacterium]
MLNLIDTLTALAGHDVRVVGHPHDYLSVSTDSRNIQPGELFVALRGDRFDGHAFVADVLHAGAAAALVDNAWASANDTQGLALIVVDDTRRAFATLANAWRRTFALPLVGVVGSNGKTTVKEMIASILAAEVGENHRLATTGNLNNDIGVPLMLLRLRAEHQVAVIEVGMNHPGETAELAAMIEPTVVVINNAQREHQEFMKTVAAVAEEHAAALVVLPSDGTAVLNADDAFFEFWKEKAGGRAVVSFGFNATADVRFISAHTPNRIEISTPQGHCEVKLTTVGKHNIRNALAAAAAALATGCSLSGVVAGLASFRPVKGRLQVHLGLSGSTVIDDTYNANPDSARAAIDVLTPLSGRRLFVLGDMGEVGDNGAQYHEEIGSYAKAQGIDALLAIGPMSRAAVMAFGTGARHFDDADELLSVLAPQLDANVVVLVKGSRFMRMERIADAIKQNTNTGSAGGTSHVA